jgi:hypothetical protein
MRKLEEASDENQKQCHEIEPNPSKDRPMPEGDNPLCCVEFTKCPFILDSSIHIRILKLVRKYLATGLNRPSGTNSPPAEASTQGLKSKTNTLTMLIHQMHISITQSDNNAKT